jgi:hypothetical protein
LAGAEDYRPAELEILKPNHFTKAEQAVYDALWTYYQALEGPSEYEWGKDLGVVAEMGDWGFRISIVKHDGTKVPLIEVSDC